MSSLSQLLGSGSGPIAQIINAASGGGAVQGLSFAACKSYASGALTANVLETVLTVTGRGVVHLCGVRSANATNRTIRMQIVVDGVTVFDATSGAITNNSSGMWGIGFNAGTGPYSFQAVSFNSSFVVRVASNLTEADGIVTGALFEVWQ